MFLFFNVASTCLAMLALRGESRRRQGHRVTEGGTLTTFCPRQYIPRSSVYATTRVGRAGRDTQSNKAIGPDVRFRPPWPLLCGLCQTPVYYTPFTSPASSLEYPIDKSLGKRMRCVPRCPISIFALKRLELGACPGCGRRAVTFGEGLQTLCYIFKNIF